MKIPHTLTETGSTAPESALPHPGKVTEISLKGTKKYQKNIYIKYQYNERQCENTSVPPLSVRVTEYIVTAHCCVVCGGGEGGAGGGIHCPSSEPIS